MPLANPFEVRFTVHTKIDFMVLFFNFYCESDNFLVRAINEILGFFSIDVDSVTNFDLFLFRFTVNCNR